VTRLPDIPVDVERIRQIFKESGLLQAATSGAYQTELVRESVDPTGSNNQPIGPQGTKSQVLWLLNTRRERVALFHRYLEPSGRLAAGGLPDPKVVVHDGRRYVLKPAAQPASGAKPPPATLANPRPRRPPKRQ
jgi:hypothetical protein